MNTIEPIVALNIYPMDVMCEADDLQDGIELSQEQIVRIMDNVKETIKNDSEFLEEYFTIVRECIRSEIFK
jgi:hypothetical protein